PGHARCANLEKEAAIHPFHAAALEATKLKKFLPGMKGKVSHLSEQDFRRIRAPYRGLISEVDDHLRRFCRALKAAGTWEDTVIVLTGDHAEMMGDHFMLGKGGFFDGSYHVPLIVRDPCRRAARGTAVDRFTEAVDVMPTLMELMGLEASAW